MILDNLKSCIFWTSRISSFSCSWTNPLGFSKDMFHQSSIKGHLPSSEAADALKQPPLVQQPWSIMQTWTLDSITVVELTCIRTLFIEYLSQTDSFNVLQEKASLIAIDAVCPHWITLDSLNCQHISNISWQHSHCQHCQLMSNCPTVQLAWLKKEWQI